MSQYVSNAIAWVSKLPLTNVKFMYFNANDLRSPKVITPLKQFQTQKNKKFYITNGEAMNFLYIYMESVIKYLVNLKPTGKATIYDANILDSGPSYDVNLGNHVDIGIIRMRDGNTLLKTHKTFYTDIGNYVFDRTAPFCNFVFDPTSVPSLENTRCQLPNGSYQGMMNNVYTQDEMDAIKTVCQNMLVTHGGKKRQGGGSFMLSGPQLYENFVKPLAEIRSDLLEIVILHEDRSRHAVALVDFVDYTRSIVLLEFPVLDKTAITRELLKLSPQKFDPMAEETTKK